MKDKCIICNNNDWEVYCKVENNKYDLLICRCCSLAKLSPMPTENELEHFYATEYRKLYSKSEAVSKHTIQDEQNRADNILKIIKPYFEPRESICVLDIGCSAGVLLKNLYHLNSNIDAYGIEMNDKYREYIINNKILNKENISNSDINTYYRTRENQFDFITIVHVLEHLHNPRITLESIFKLLNRGGKLYIEVPNIKTPYYNLKKQYFRIYHLYYFSDFTLRNLLESVGFKILVEQQIARTSIAFICVKDSSELKKNFLNCNTTESKNIKNILKIYRVVEYPIYKLKMIAIQLLEILGIKEQIKLILKKNKN